MNKIFDNIRNTAVGTVEFVSAKEIKVLLDIEAPFNTALNTGNPQLFPRINGYLLIPNESGALIGIITWIGIEYSAYPKRQGYKDFNLVDLPFPLRKLSLSPIGVLKEKDSEYEIERGVYSFPSVGDTVIIPSNKQLKAIVQNKEPEAKVKIGVSPLAANAPIYVNPDKLFGRHLAVLGNTGSGKSCSVAGLIRWSIESAKNEIQNDKAVNARFIILDPNGEYTNCFDDLANVKKYAVKLREEGETKQLKVPSWMWNSWEWISIAQASARTQRPLLQRALREIKNAKFKDNTVNNAVFSLRRYYTSVLIEISNDFNKGVQAFKGKPGKNDFGKKLKSIVADIENDANKSEYSNYKTNLETLSNTLSEIENNKYKSFTNDKNEIVEYYDDFNKDDIEKIINSLDEFLINIGGLLIYEGPDEDSPIFFKNEDFLAHLERLANEKNQQQYIDFFLMRVRSLFTDKRITSVINTENSDELTLEQWLKDYIGDNENNPSLTIIDLSLLPSEIIYLVTSVIARIIFEAHQRHKKHTGNILPTVLVVDEAHNLIKRYDSDDDNISSQRLCSQIFEKIAKEGRKFGVGLVIASQRPSELSQTALSQCNTFLLHRIVSDRDQEMVKKLVPDTMGSILNELSILPSRKAILLGWAAPIPVLIEVNELKEEHRPKSKDPDFWNVWTNKKEIKIEWNEIVEEWQENNKKDQEISTDDKDNASNQ